MARRSRKRRPALAFALDLRHELEVRPHHQFLAALFEPVRSLTDPGRRVFFPFLLASLLVSGVVWCIHLRGRVGLLAFVFPRGVWLHRSALLDYKLLFARALLDASLRGAFVVSKIVVAMRTAAFLVSTFGTARFAIPATVAAGVFALSAFVVEDFVRYVVHRLAHRMPWFWELHKVHHSADVLTPFTLYRTHPVESVLVRASGATAVGVVAGLCSWGFGKVTGWEILGVDALGWIWSAAGANLRHSHVWISYGRRAEHVLMSPAQHQIHHSADARHFDRNFGSALALWDWVFGTLYVPKGRERLRFGLPEGELNHNDTVLSAWVSPLLAAVRALLPARRAATSRPRQTPRSL